MERASYICCDCQATVSPGAYRATCPDCNGKLRPDSVTNRRRAAE
ncbi:hypothetical protein ACFQJC_07795 [Haloferax namakaokahaiae]|uniref:Rubrerythrin-like domain-containing protein n=1 Tax=Haloferax namakaokahaiae TaxID=1748331 RepID=A0ABD5ZE38_9EURY